MTGALRLGGRLPWAFVSLRRASVIALSVGAFLVVSFLVARFLTQENRERAAVTDLLDAQARGDVPAMLRGLHGCDAACRRTVEADARRLRRAGAVKILSYRSSTGYAIGTERGPTRVAWNINGTGFPVVQCVDVERSGSALLGGSIRLRGISAPIPGGSLCPK